MQIEQRLWTSLQGWQPSDHSELADRAQLVFIFGATQVLANNGHFQEVRNRYPNAHLCGCSTAGEIFGTRVLDDSLVVTAVHFEKTHLQAAAVSISETAGSFDAGQRLAKALDHHGLAHVFVISDGLKVNGSELTAGMAAALPRNVSVTGGLSGDGSRFAQTLV